MPISKRDTAIGAIVALLLIGGRKALASSKAQPKPSPQPKNDPDADGAALLKRANQKQAMGWAALFADTVSPLTAAALARWAGIESSGNPTARSRLDERGVLQAGPAAVADGELTQAEFDALVSPSTSKAQHAALAIKYADALAHKADTYLAHAPADPIDRIWYAKLWHQRPVDVRDAHLTGVALDDARRLATEWAADPKAMHRLRAANVVAWGTPTP